MTDTNRKYELPGGYRINRVINGCWQLSEGHSLSGALDMDDVMRAFHMLVERGFTTFDCADIYTGAEDFIGRFVGELKAMGGYSHDCLQIHTKYVPDLDRLSTVRFEDTERIIDRSLRRLKRDGWTWCSTTGGTTTCPAAWRWPATWPGCGKRARSATSA